jgi:hypothetical protein
VKTYSTVEEVNQGVGEGVSEAVSLWQQQRSRPNFYQIQGSMREVIRRLSQGGRFLFFLEFKLILC